MKKKKTKKINGKLIEKWKTNKIGNFSALKIEKKSLRSKRVSIFAQLRVSLSPHVEPSWMPYTMSVRDPRDSRPIVWFSQIEIGIHLSCIECVCFELCTKYLPIWPYKYYLPILPSRIDGRCETVRIQLHVRTYFEFSCIFVRNNVNQCMKHWNESQLLCIERFLCWNLLKVYWAECNWIMYGRVAVAVVLRLINFHHVRLHSENNRHYLVWSVHVACQ